MSIQMTQDFEIDSAGEIFDIYAKPSRCLGCDATLHHFSLLICAECLDDEQGCFLNLAQPLQIK